MEGFGVNVTLPTVTNLRVAGRLPASLDELCSIALGR